MKLIGLTGPTGAGKGTVAMLFATHGIPVLDADRIYKELLLPPSQCLDALTEAFGREILCADGTLNRKALAGIVFTDSEKLKELNRIAHSFVMKEVKSRLQAFRKCGTPAVVFDAPQLFEAGADKDCDVIVSVVAPAKIRRERICARDGISEALAQQRMDAQYPDGFFREHSTYIIENNSKPDALTAPVEQILKELHIIK